MKKTALIMAGGRGERFWPKSRTTLPKQFLSLTDDGQTMIQNTINRILPLVDMEDIYVVTNEIYRNLVLQQLPLLPADHILCEPASRNTAPCIGLGAIYMAQKYGDATMLVLPSDHLIKNAESFLKTLENACEIAASGENLVTLGILPNYAETGYGYIKYSPSLPFMQGFQVERFVEKPSQTVAEEYLRSGDYLWNSGMFIWNVSTILKKMRELIPDTYNYLMQIKNNIGSENEYNVLKTAFLECKSESVDYAIMEHASNIYTIPGDFGWDDVGSWLALERHKSLDDKHNSISGNVVSLDMKNCIIDGGERLIAAIGIENLIVVDTNDCLLICTKNQCGKIKEVLKTISKQNPSLL